MAVRRFQEVFQTQIHKGASLCPAGTPDETQREKINTLSKSALRAEDIYCFRVRLCDDLPDRDFERFDTNALPQMANLFLGKTGICDHEWSTERQVARIFDTEVQQEDGVSFLLAHAYMLRSEKNADLIADIEGGIKKEVSVGCAMGASRCSICGEHYGTCSHQKGSYYDGKLCLAVLSEPLDAYEFSFVAVPAQRASGVLKGQKGGLCMTLQECVSKHGTPTLCDRLTALEAEAAMGREYRAALVQEIVSLGLTLDFGASEPILRKAAEALTCSQLRDWKQAMERRAAVLFPPKAQLSAAKNTKSPIESAYII